MSYIKLKLLAFDLTGLSPVQRTTKSYPPQNPSTGLSTVGVSVSRKIAEAKKFSEVLRRYTIWVPPGSLTLLFEEGEDL